MSLIGQRVGPFEIVEPAKVPEPGQWWIARRTGGHRKGPDTVLVRVLPPDADDAARTELQRSYDLLRAIEDPRVPEPVAYFEGMGALALSAVSGVSLLEAVAARSEGLPVSEATVVDLLLEIGETLQRVHHRNRCHGHLAPDRIVLAADGGVWIFGFGQPEAAPDPIWAAPERLRGEPAGPATDQWSLAVLALGLVTGKPPRESAGTPERPDPAVLAGRLDARWPALGRLVRRMLDPNPAQRYPSLQPIRQELLGLSRKSDKVSERRELATLLRHRRPAPSLAEVEVEVELTPAEPVHPVRPSADLPAEVAPVQAEVAPAAVVAPVAARPEPVPEPPAPPTPPPAPLRRVHQRLPEEEIPVVRPHLVGEVPIARGRGVDPAPVAATSGPFAPMDGSSVDELEPAPSSASVEIDIDPVSELEVELSAEGELPPPPPGEPEDPPALPATFGPPRPATSPWTEDPVDEQLVTSPTVVPLTESEDSDVTPPPRPQAPPTDFREPEPNDPPSQSEMWFASAPPPDAPADPSLGLSGIPPEAVGPVLADEEGPPEAVDRPTAADALATVPITRIAPWLVGALVLLLALWGLIRLL